MQTGNITTTPLVFSVFRTAWSFYRKTWGLLLVAMVTMQVLFASLAFAQTELTKRLLAGEITERSHFYYSQLSFFILHVCIILGLLLTACCMRSAPWENSARPFLDRLTQVIHGLIRYIPIVSIYYLFQVLLFFFIGTIFSNYSNDVLAYLMLERTLLTIFAFSFVPFLLLIGPLHRYEEKSGFPALVRIFDLLRTNFGQAILSIVILAFGIFAFSVIISTIVYVLLNYGINFVTLLIYTQVFIATVAVAGYLMVWPAALYFHLWSSNQ